MVDAQKHERQWTKSFQRARFRMALLLCFILWMLIFGMGLLIDSGPFRMKLLQPPAAQSNTNTPEAAKDNAEQDSHGPPEAAKLAQKMNWFVRIGRVTIVHAVPTDPNRAVDRDNTPAEKGPGAVQRLRWHLSITGAKTFLFAVLIYTPTNLALLCCLSAVLGSIGRRLSEIGPRELAGEIQGGDSSREVKPETSSSDVKIASSLLRGFCVYLLLISGLIVLTGEPFHTPSQEAYIRLAGAASILAFVAGFRKDFFPSGLKQIGSHG